MLQAICVEEISLACLIRPPHQRHASSTSTDANIPSIFPIVFELHIPCDVLTYLFYAIGKEYPLLQGGGLDDEFDIDEHEHYTAAVADGEETPIHVSNDDDENDEDNVMAGRIQIKQVSLLQFK